MVKPVIGKTFHRKVKDNYGAAVSICVCLPLYLGPVAEPQDVLGLVQCIIFSGGGDVLPDFFQEVITEGSGVPDVARDEFELALVRLAVAQGIPLLGICRGMQVINIALGGSVNQDIGTSHAQAANPLTPTHDIKIDYNSCLYKSLKREILPVNSFHHQSVKVLGRGLRTVAQGPGGIIEAIEAPGVWGVQWHPEWLYHREPEQGLFTAFIDLCREYYDNTQKSPVRKT